MLTVIRVVSVKAGLEASRSGSEPDSNRVRGIVDGND